MEKKLYLLGYKTEQAKQEAKEDAALAGQKANQVCPI
jgi:hypothetical protein